MEIRKQLVKRNIAGDVILVPIGDASLELKGLVTLNETGELLWDRLPQAADAADLAAALPKDFPLPARYAHPVVLTRMIRVLREGRAQTADQALEVVKQDLKALTADVQVEQEEYDEIVQIKAMFLNHDYQ